VCIWANAIYYYFFYFIYQTFGFHWGPPNQIMIRNFKVVCIRIYKFIIFYDSFIMRSSFFYKYLDNYIILSLYTLILTLFFFLSISKKKHFIPYIINRYARNHVWTLFIIYHFYHYPHHAAFFFLICSFLFCLIFFFIDLVSFFFDAFLTIYLIHIFVFVNHNLKKPFFFVRDVINLFIDSLYTVN
jgi:hypothetical protein